MRYVLNDFAQGLTVTAPVRVEVQFFDDTAGVSGMLPCNPIPAEWLPAAWTNEDLRAACEKMTGKPITLPVSK
jgi:hypothetical protein